MAVSAPASRAFSPAFPIVSPPPPDAAKILCTQSRNHISRGRHPAELVPACPAWPVPRDSDLSAGFATRQRRNLHLRRRIHRFSRKRLLPLHSLEPSPSTSLLASFLTLLAASPSHCPAAACFAAAGQKEQPVGPLPWHSGHVGQTGIGSGGGGAGVGNTDCGGWMAAV
jgi:hypothetical protein